LLICTLTGIFTARLAFTHCFPALSLSIAVETVVEVTEQASSTLEASILAASACALGTARVNGSKVITSTSLAFATSFIKCTTTNLRWLSGFHEREVIASTNVATVTSVIKCTTAEGDGLSGFGFGCVNDSNAGKDKLHFIGTV
jgi:hypothetical protein